MLEFRPPPSCSSSIPGDGLCLKWSSRAWGGHRGRWSLPSGDNGPAFSPHFRPASLLPLRQGAENKAPIAGLCHFNASFCSLPPGSRVCPLPSPPLRPCSWHFLPAPIDCCHFQKGWIVLWPPGGPAQGPSPEQRGCGVKEAPTTLKTENSLNLLPKTPPCAGANAGIRQQSGSWHSC